MKVNHIKYILLFLFTIYLLIKFSFNPIKKIEQNKNFNIEKKIIKPTLHIIGLFHTITSSAYSHCAFTSKVLKFSKMMHFYDWHLVEYGNELTESGADQFFKILTREELYGMIGERDKTKFQGENATIVFFFFFSIFFFQIFFS